MDQRGLKPPHFSVQMEALFSQIKRLSLKGGHNTSIDHRPSSISEDAVVDRLPQIECNVLLDELPPVMETKKKKFNHYYLAKLRVQMQFLPRSTELFHCMWRKEVIPQKVENASITYLYKQKGNPQVL